MGTSSLVKRWEAAALGKKGATETDEEVRHIFRCVKTFVWSDIYII